jgi:hypothetical protein
MLMHKLGAGRKKQQKNAADAYQPSPIAILFETEQTPAHVNQCSASPRAVRPDPENLQVS